MDSLNFPGNVTDTNITLLTEDMNLAFRRGVTFVAARGNLNSDVFLYPSCVDSNWVLSVSATNSLGVFKTASGEEPFWGSSWGRGVDVAAPGVYSMIRTTGPIYFSDYVPFSGTSGAAPHVTGAAAMLISYMSNGSLPHINLSPDDCEYIIQHSATAPSGPGPYWDPYIGHGRLNIGKAMRMIEKPYRRLYQFSTGGGTSYSFSKSVYSSSDTVTLTERYQNYQVPRKWFQKGKYIVKTFQITATVNHNLGFVTDSVMYCWPRHSASYGFGLFNAQKKLTPHEQVKVNSCNATSASLSCFVYEVKDLAGNPLGWWTCDTSFTDLTNHSRTLFAYSVISKNTAVGIHENNKEEQEVKLFPNPAGHKQNLVIKCDKASACSIELYDIMGRNLQTVYQGKIQAGENVMVSDVEKLPDSMYFYIIKLDDNTISKKFIKN